MMANQIAYVSAAYGSVYHRYAIGLARSFARYCPGGQLVIYADRDIPEAWNPGHVAVDTSIPQHVLDTWLAGDYMRMAKVFLMVEHARRTGAFDLCWLDVDLLVLDDLSELLMPGFPNAVLYGYGQEKRDCGNGLKVRQRDYAVSYLYCLPGLSACEHRARITVGSRTWKDRSPERSPEQETWNHYLRGCTSFVALNLAHADRVWNFEPWGWHPDVGRASLMDAELVAEAVMFGSRRAAVMPWLARCLKQHLADGPMGFASFKHGKLRDLFQEFYRAD